MEADASPVASPAGKRRRPSESEDASGDNPNLILYLLRKDYRPEFAICDSLPILPHILRCLLATPSKDRTLVCVLIEVET